MGNKKKGAKGHHKSVEKEDVESEYDTANLRWRRIAEVTLYLGSQSNLDRTSGASEVVALSQKNATRKDEQKVLCHCTRLFCK